MIKFSITVYTDSNKTFDNGTSIRGKATRSCLRPFSCANRPARTFIRETVQVSPPETLMTKGIRAILGESQPCWLRWRSRLQKVGNCTLVDIPVLVNCSNSASSKVLILWQSQLKWSAGCGTRKVITAEYTKTIFLAPTRICGSRGYSLNFSAAQLYFDFKRHILSELRRPRSSPQGPQYEYYSIIASATCFTLGVS